jgi:hypothetical protein
MPPIEIFDGRRGGGTSGGGDDRYWIPHAFSWALPIVHWGLFVQAYANVVVPHVQDPVAETPSQVHEMVESPAGHV